MTKLDIVNGVTGFIHKTGFKLKKHSPEILVVTGVVGTVVSAVMACKATTKLSDILAETKETVDTIHSCTNNEELPMPYSEEDAKKDLTIVYVQTGLKIAKLYAPSVILGALSITGILASNNIMRKRNVALAAAYATVDNSFKEYRGRVVERFGEGLDRELKYNIKAKEIEEKIVNEDGSETTVKKTVEVADPGYSEYSVFFCEGCNGWDKNPEYNKAFLSQQQRYANDKLRSKRYLLLNDVYEMLGVPVTEQGSLIGWVYDPSDPTLQNHVDFGVLDVYTNSEKLNQARRDFVNGWERSILLDFNVDGNVWHLMK